MTEVSNRIATIPNLLSLVRLLLIPVFFVFLAGRQFGWALVALAGASLTDLLDGMIARRFNQVTKLGQQMDPVADRLTILAALLGLGFAGVIPWWLVVLILARDVMIVLLGIPLTRHGYGWLPVHHLGKLATFALLTALPLLIVGMAFPVIAAWMNPIAWATALWGVFLYWWAGILYARQTVQLVRAVTPPGSESAPSGPAPSGPKSAPSAPGGSDSVER